MRDTTEFERRLADAFERMAAPAPVLVDAAALARAVMTNRLPRRSLGERLVGDRRAVVARLRLVLVIGAIGIALAGALLLGGGGKGPVPPQGPSASPQQQAPTRAPTPVGTDWAGYRGVFTSTGSPPQSDGGLLLFDELVLLADGRVLGLGNSWPERTPQLMWDPSTGQFEQLGLLGALRQEPVGVLLADGRVLVIGGDITVPATDSEGGVTGSATYSTAEIFDPARGEFSPAGPMVGRGWAPTAIRLADGRVLVLDGLSVDDADRPNPQLATAEVYDPTTNKFTATQPMTVARGPAEMALLRDGRVLVVGGNPPTADIFDPESGSFTALGPMPPTEHPAGGQYWPMTAGPLVPMLDGQVLVAGRRCQEVGSIVADNHPEGWYPSSAAYFDPASGAFTAAEPMPHCVETATPLRDGLVLLTAFWEGPGGQGSGTWAGILDPMTGRVGDVASPRFGRYVSHVALNDGTVLFVSDAAEVFR